MYTPLKAERNDADVLTQLGPWFLNNGNEKTDFDHMLMSEALTPEQVSGSPAVS